MDEYEYFSPDFNPSAVTVPRLRSILVAHNVKYPSSAKKPELIALFNQHVAPQAQRHLAAQSRTKRSTRGITDVPSSRETSVAQSESDEDEVASLAPSESVRRSTRRSTRGMTEESDAPSLAPSASTRRSTRRTTASVEPDLDLTPVPRSRASRSPSKRASTKPVRAPELENIDERTPAARAPKQHATPVVKQQDHDEASPFSTDNPFQSGSPAYEPRSVERDRRRTTLGTEHGDKRNSSVSRRKTEVISAASEHDDALSSSARRHESSAVRRRDPTPKKRSPTPAIEQEEEDMMAVQESEEEQEGLDAGEEFTPEEQLELVRERAAQGKTDILPPRRSRPPRRSSGALKVAPLTILVTLLGGFGAWWRTEKLAVGYCGVGKTPISLDELEVPESAKGVEVLLPQCEPCPNHAYCYPELKTVCEPDFILRPHPLSFGGLVPLAPTCEPDSEKARKVKAVADRAVEELRDRKAKFECGDPMGDTGTYLASPEINEQELKEEISTKRRKGMSQVEFDDLWSSAIGDVMLRDEVVSQVDGESGTRKIGSKSLARISLACATRRSIRLALARHLWKLISLLAMFGAFLYSKSAWVSSAATEKRAKLLASFALDQLKVQAAYHAHQPRRYPEGFISMAQLRDDILRDEFSAKRRQKLWERVQRKVEQNSNVRPSVRETRTGDVSRVWEWVGAVGAIENGDVKQEQGRLSMGSNNAALTHSPPEPQVKEEMKERKAWEEVPILVRTAQVVGITSAAWWSGACGWISLSLIPTINKSPVDLRVKQWKYQYELGMTSGPALALASGVSFCYLMTQHGKHFGLLSERSFNLNALAAVAVPGIVPFTLLFIKPVNDKLMGHAESLEEGKQSGEAALTEQDVESLIARWNKLHAVRARRNAHSSSLSVNVIVIHQSRGGCWVSVQRGSRAAEPKAEPTKVGENEARTTSKDDTTANDSPTTIRDPQQPSRCQHRVTQYKAGKASLFAQGKRRYDRKQSGYGGQTKPVFHKKAKTTKKVVLRLECTTCKTKAQLSLKRCKHFELGGDKKTKGAALVF
ncbi:60s ribosomal protein l44 [Diplodia corticola]|uniref:60s ribosomal protein l44 n=1 Tax=Diplodia corticola TaxID=236234 RepID=A0A1J9RX21_9PEZI|nr:60s ribosomal protein l44 [Diplodia corticola]OJD37187.1 60s ribosomal protein l44 [Diplodia corticola]